MVNMLLIYAENKTALPEHMKSFVTLNHCKGSALLKVPFYSGCGCAESYPTDHRLNGVFCFSFWGFWLLLNGTVDSD